jgi:hypothetical protein
MIGEVRLVFSPVSVAFFVNLGRFNFIGVERPTENQMKDKAKTRVSVLVRERLERASLICASALTS